MKPTLLHGIAAPSLSVLSFLRSQVRIAFDSPGSQCFTFQRQQRGYNVGSQGRLSDARCKRSKVELQRGPEYGRLSTSSECLMAQRIGQAAINGSYSTSSLVRTLPHGCTTTFCRTFSTTRRQDAWSLFKAAKMRRLAQLSPPSPPPEENPSSYSNGFGSSLGRIMRPANELKMRCTELDEHGNVTLVSGEFKKSELIAKVGSLLQHLILVEN